MCKCDSSNCNDAEKCGTGGGSGYTKNKKLAHVISVLAIAFIGLVLVIFALMDTRHLKTAAIVIGVVIILVCMLALIPIMRKETVDG